MLESFFYAKDPTVIHRDRTKEMSLKQVLEYTRDIPIDAGGLGIILQKIVDEIEELKGKG